MDERLFFEFIRNLANSAGVWFEADFADDTILVYRNPEDTPQRMKFEKNDFIELVTLLAKCFDTDK